MPPAGTWIGLSIPGTIIDVGSDAFGATVPGGLTGPPFANSVWYDTEGSCSTPMFARGGGGLSAIATPGSGRSSTTFAHLSSFSATPTAISASC